MKKFYFPLVLAITLFISVWLAAVTYRINFWPTDSELAYIPSATQVFSTPFISDLHHATFFQFNIMHGKEALVVAIAVAQRFLNDYESLFPNILVLILATAGSGILIFLILRQWLTAECAWWGFLFFITTFWTYQYVLQGAHQPLVMFYFLLTVFLIFKLDNKKRSYFYTGLVLGIMLFSSPTAAIYFPYLLGAYFLIQHKLQPNSPLIKWIAPSIWIASGAIVMILIFTLPDPVGNFRDFLAFVRSCQKENHFQIAEGITGMTLPRRGAGVIWIIKYFTLIMPVLFGIYIMSLLYLVKTALKKNSIWIVVALSLSTPIAVEIIQVAQFGRNYFACLIGIIIGCSYALYHFLNHPSTTPRQKKLWNVLLTVIFSVHLGFNAWVFLKDILPSRMATTYIYDWLNGHAGQKFAYLLHPHNVNTINVLNHPNTKNPIRFKQIQSIKEAPGGYMAVPMYTGKSIYLNCTQKSFSGDPELTKLINSGEFKNYVAASFPTMASSHFWPQEEELCTYLDLITHEITDKERQLGYMWILDADKLQKEWFKNK